MLVVSLLFVLPVLAVCRQYYLHPAFRAHMACLPSHGTVSDWLMTITQASLSTLLDFLLLIGRTSEPRQPSRIVFVVGIPRGGSTSTHRSLTHCTGATCAKTVDLLVPPAPGLLAKIQGLFLPLLDLLVKLSFDATGKRHHIGLSLPEEEDQAALHQWKGVGSMFPYSPQLNSTVWRLGGKRTDASSMPYIDRLIRWTCAAESSDLFIGKPLQSTAALAVLMDHFPKAQFVVGYREPVACLASALSLRAANLHKSFSEELWIQIFKDMLPDMYRVVIETLSKYGQDRRFAFNSFSDWKADPKKQVERLCAQLDLPIVDPSPPPKDEDNVPDELGQLYKRKALQVIQADWEVWEPIYDKLGFAKPSFD